MPNEEKKISVAIDGPSGAGKSTLARAAAGKLGLRYVDTGAVYRTVVLYILRKNAAVGDEAAVAALLPDVKISISYDDKGMQHMNLNGEDVTGLIRTQEISMAASDVAKHPCVRDFLLHMQRSLASARSVIMDGRDIGTVVLPQADVKIFLTASSEERARRRWLELERRGEHEDYEQVLQKTRRRDEEDAARAIAPLRPAEDAVILDTTSLDFEESLARIIEIIRERTAI